MKIDRRPKLSSSSMPKVSKFQQQQHKLVLIKGVAYRSNKRQLERINKTARSTRKVTSPRKGLPKTKGLTPHIPCTISIFRMYVIR